MQLIAKRTYIAIRVQEKSVTLLMQVSTDYSYYMELSKLKVTFSST